MSDPQYGPAGEKPSFDKPAPGAPAQGGPGAPDASGPQGYPPQQPGYGQAPPPYGQVGGYPQQGAQGYSQELSPSDQRLWATLAHIGGILFSVIGPLVVFLVQKDKGLYVTEQSKEALNFQITLLIGYVVSGVLTIVVIGIIGLVVLPVLAIVFGIIAAIAANKGENYRYPLTLRLVK